MNNRTIKVRDTTNFILQKYLRNFYSATNHVITSINFEFANSGTNFAYSKSNIKINIKRKKYLYKTHRLILRLTAKCKIFF